MTLEQQATQVAEQPKDPIEVLSTLWRRLAQESGVSEYDTNSVENLVLTLLDPATPRAVQLIHSLHFRQVDEHSVEPYSIGKMYGQIDEALGHDFLTYVVSEILSHMPATATTKRFFTRLRTMTKLLREERGKRAESVGSVEEQEEAQGQ